MRAEIFDEFSTRELVALAKVKKVTAKQLTEMLGVSYSYFSKFVCGLFELKKQYDDKLREILHDILVDR